MTAAIHVPQSRRERSASLHRALVQWIFESRDALVFDFEGEPPARVVTLLEEEQYDLFSKYLVAVLEGGAYPRTICAGCYEADCNGCRGFVPHVVLPQRITNLLAEARR